MSFVVPSLTTDIMLAICAFIIASVKLNIIQRPLDGSYRRMGFLIARAASQHATSLIFLLGSHVGHDFRFSPRVQGHTALYTELSSGQHLLF